MKYYITFYQDINGKLNQFRKFRIERPKDAKDALLRFQKHGKIRAAWLVSEARSGFNTKSERIQF
jgi:hypothetical protein